MSGKRWEVLILVVVSIVCIVPFTQCDDDEEDTTSKPFVNSTDPICLTTKCKDKPKMGDCVPTDPSNSSLTEKAGKYRMCCPVWECTHSNGSITEHWGYHCLQAKQSNTTKKTSQTSSTVVETATYRNYSRTTYIWNMQMSIIQSSTCAPVKCSMQPTEGTCEEKDSSSTALASKAGAYKPCCSIWNCKMANGRVFMSYGMSMSWTYASSESKSSSSQSTEMAKEEPVSCSLFECGTQPVKYGTCVAKNVSDATSNATSIFGPMSYCCPMWECTSETGVVTEHYALIRIAKNETSPDGSGSGKPMGRSLIGIKKFCDNVECIKPNIPSGGVCEVIMPMKSTAQTKSACCPMYQCKGKSGAIMSYESYYATTVRVMYICETYIIYDETMTVTTEEILEGEGMSSKTCPKSRCPPPPKKADCSELDAKQVTRIQNKLGVKQDTCCPVIRCKNDESSYIVYYVMRMTDAPPSGKGSKATVITIIEPKEEDNEGSGGRGAGRNLMGITRPGDKKCANIKCNRPSEKDVSSGNCKPLERVDEGVMSMMGTNDTCCPVYKCDMGKETYLKYYGSSPDNDTTAATTVMGMMETTMKPMGRSFQTVMKPTGMMETTKKPMEMMETTMKPMTMMETTMKPMGRSFQTFMKPTGMMETTKKPMEMMETTMKPMTMMETTMKPMGRSFQTAMKPAGMMETTKKPMGMMETTMKPMAMMETTMKPMGRSFQTVMKPMETMETMKPMEMMETTMKPMEMMETTMKPMEMMETTMKPMEMMETTMKPMEMMETTMKPIAMPMTVLDTTVPPGAPLKIVEISLKQVETPVGAITMKPVVVEMGGMDTTMQPTAMPRAIMETTMQPTPMPPAIMETTMPPTPMPSAIMETTMPPTPMPRAMMETTMPPTPMPRTIMETTMQPMGGMDMAKTTKRPKSEPNIKKGLVNSTNNVIMTPSTNPSRQCTSILCFPPSDEKSCKPTNITECSILKVLGNLAKCCPAYACRNESAGTVTTQMGLTDGLSETVLTYEQTDEEFKKNPEKCDEIAVLSENFVTEETPTPAPNMVTKPIPPVEGGNSPTTKPRKPLPRIEYVTTCDGISCMNPPGVNVTGCEMFKDWLTDKMKELGITETCCPLYKCRQEDGSVATEFSINAKSYGTPEGPSVVLKFDSTVNTTNTKKSLPNQLADRPKGYSTCPGVKCIPPMINATCKPAPPNCVKNGPLRNQKNCCPLWQCQLKNGVFIVYGRTATEDDMIFTSSRVQIQSIFMTASTSHGEEENADTEFSDGKGLKGRSKTSKKKWSSSSASAGATQLTSENMAFGSSKKTDNEAFAQFGQPQNCGNCPPNNENNGAPPSSANADQPPPMMMPSFMPPGFPYWMPQNG